MSYEFDQVENIGRVYFYDSSAGTYTERDRVSGDYFDDNSDIGDCLYFGKGYGGVTGGMSSTPFHDLTVYIGTSLVAESITVSWEYQDEGSWIPIDGYTDNTNAFQSSGSQSVLFDIPQDMSANTSSFYVSNFPISGVNMVWIRCRITEITGISEGGANSTNSITIKNNRILVTNEDPVTMESIYSADISGSWGVVSKIGSEQYLCRACLYLVNSDFKSYGEQIIFGQDTYEVTIGGNKTSTWVFGYKNSEGYGYGGTDIRLYTKNSYNLGSFSNFDFYGSQIWKSGGGYMSPPFSIRCDIRDSSLSGDYYYFTSGINQQSYFYRTNYNCSYHFYCYTGSILIDKAYFPYDSLSCDGLLLGGGVSGSRVDNISLVSTSQKIFRNYADNPRFYNCYFANTDWTNETGLFYLNRSPTAGANRHVYIYYSLDLTVIDEEGNPILNANISIIDGQSNIVTEVTDIDGKIETQECLVWDAYIESPTWTRKNIDHRWYKIKVTASGYEPYEHEWLFVEQANFRIKLKRVRCNSMHRTVI